MGSIRTPSMLSWWQEISCTRLTHFGCIVYCTMYYTWSRAYAGFVKGRFVRGHRCNLQSACQFFFSMLLINIHNYNSLFTMLRGWIMQDFETASLLHVPLHELCTRGLRCTSTAGFCWGFSYWQDPCGEIKWRNAVMLVCSITAPATCAGP